MMVDFLRDDLSDKVERLEGEGLERLMCQLLKEEERLCEVEKPSDHGKINHADQGCDYWTYSAKKSSCWLDGNEACWQFKSQTALSPESLKKEIQKNYPQKALKGGGRYIFVANKKSGKIQKNRIFNIFKDAYPQYEKNIVVYLLESIVDFCVSHPAIACSFLKINIFKLVEGLHSWSEMKEHDANKIQWEGDDLREEAGVQIRRLFDKNGFKHVHIAGETGVGKTRFALEVCKAAKWKNRVLYGIDFDSASVDIRKLVNEFRCDIVLAVDEINDTEELKKLRRICEGHENIKLLTMGHAKIDDQEFSYSIVLKIMSEDAIVKIVNRWHGRIYSHDFSRYVAHWVGGYVRLAKVFSFALHDLITKDKRGFAGVKELLGQKPIIQLIKGLYDDNDLKYLHVLSLLRVIEFKNDMVSEAQIVAKHLKLNWEDFLRAIKRIKEKDHIIQQAGNYLYLPPNLLAVHLAVDAWDTYGDERIFSLAEKLSSEAKKRFSERLSEVSQIIPDFAKKKLYEIQAINYFLTEDRCRFWQSFSNADPLLAVSKLMEVLLQSSIEEKLQIKDEARSILVATLSRYANIKNSSEESMIALAELAVAENASWANNATGEFTERFQFFGQSPDVFNRYFNLLDRIIKKNKPEYTKLVLSALENSIKTMVGRILPQIYVELSVQSGKLEPDKDEKTQKHMLRVLKKIDDMFPEIIDKIKNNDNLRAPFLLFLSQVANLFRYKTLRTEAEKIFEKCDSLKTIMREDIRKILFDAMEWIKKFGNPTEAEIIWIETLHSKFQDISLKGRIRETIIQGGFHYDDKEIIGTIKDIAKEAFCDLKTIQEEWEWLTSSDAYNANLLGAELAELDKENLLLDKLPNFQNRGNNWLLLINYYIKKGLLLGDDWLNNWMLTYAEQNPEDRRLPLAVAMYGAGSDNKANFVMQSLSQGIEPRHFPWLSTIVGFWSRGLSYKVSKQFIEFLARETNHKAIALEFLYFRLSHFSNEEIPINAHSKKESILDYEGIALPLLTDIKIIRQQYEQKTLSTDHAWEVLSIMFIKETSKYEREIAITIFSACIPEIVEGKSSYIDDLAPYRSHGMIADVLKTCAEKNEHSLWQALVPHLESKNYQINVFYLDYYDFYNIFNKHLNSSSVLKWINSGSAEKDKRIDIIANIIRKIFNYDSNLQSDSFNENYLAVKMLEAYPDNQNIFKTFFINLTCGSYWGNTSLKLQEVIDELNKIKQKTSNTAIEKFIAQSLPKLEDRKKYHEEREKEEKLLYGF